MYASPQKRVTGYISSNLIVRVIFIPLESIGFINSDVNYLTLSYVFEVLHFLTLEHLNCSFILNDSFF